MSECPSVFDASGDIPRTEIFQQEIPLGVREVYIYIYISIAKYIRDNSECAKFEARIAVLATHSQLVVCREQFYYKLHIEIEKTRFHRSKYIILHKHYCIIYSKALHRRIIRATHVAKVGTFKLQRTKPSDRRDTVSRRRRPTSKIVVICRERHSSAKGVILTKVGTAHSYLLLPLFLSLDYIDRSAHSSREYSNRISFQSNTLLSGWRRVVFTTLITFKLYSNCISY